MVVLVADAFETVGHRRPEGRRVRGRPRPGARRRRAGRGAAARSRADVLVVRSTKVTAPMMDAGALALIVRAGAGYNTIDVAAASARGIYVSNCPGRNAVAVAELTLGLILALDRRIPDNVAGAARRHVGQEDVLEGGRAQGQDARPARLRRDRPRGGAARAGVRPAPGDLEPQPRSGDRPGDARPAARVPTRTSPWRRRPARSPPAATSSASTSRWRRRRAAWWTPRCWHG